MPTMPPLVSTSTTRRLRASPKAWPLSHGVSGHGTRRMLVRTAVMVMSVMLGAFGAESYCGVAPMIFICLAVRSHSTSRKRANSSGVSRIGSRPALISVRWRIVGSL